MPDLSPTSVLMPQMLSWLNWHKFSLTARKWEAVIVAVQLHCWITLLLLVYIFKKCSTKLTNRRLEGTLKYILAHDVHLKLTHRWKFTHSFDFFILYVYYQKKPHMEWFPTKCLWYRTSNLKEASSKLTDARILLLDPWDSYCILALDKGTCEMLKM